MFTNLSKKTVSLAAVRLRIARLPEGSAQKIIAQLWLDWLVHNRNCQQQGGVQFTDQCKPFDSIVEFLGSHPWDCCFNHRLLSFNHAALVARAEVFQPRPAAHMVAGGVLSPPWWRWYDARYLYNPCTQIGAD